MKLPVLGGGTAGDEALLKSYGDEAVGMIACSAYTGDLDTPSNKRLIDGMVKDYGNIPGLYSAGLYITGQVAEAALEKTGGKTDDREAFNRALRAVSLTDTPRGPFTFDRFGNVVGNIYIRRMRAEGRQARQHHDQDVSEGEPVLDVRREVVPLAAGVLARLPAR